MATPSEAHMAIATLHPHLCMLQAINIGATAPPKPVPSSGELLPNARSRQLVQTAMTLLVFGGAAAMPTPAKTRNVNSRQRTAKGLLTMEWGMRPMAPVKSDHHRTAHVKTVRAPNR